MAAGEREARLAVVYGFAPRLPMNERKVDAVVLRMAACAGCAGGISICVYGMQAAVFREPLPDLRVAVEAFELHASTAQIMALGAIECARERLVWLR